MSVYPTHVTMAPVKMAWHPSPVPAVQVSRVVCVRSTLMSVSVSRAKMEAPARTVRMPTYASAQKEPQVPLLLERPKMSKFLPVKSSFGHLL